MTKRRCPWPLETCLQLKSHIGLREVANGVNGRTYMNVIEGDLNTFEFNYLLRVLMVSYVYQKQSRILVQ